MTFVDEEVDPVGLERKSPTEAADIDEIVRGILAIQAQAGKGRQTAALARHAREGHLRARGVRSPRSPPGSGRPRTRRSSGARHLRNARHLSGHRAIRQRRRRPSSGPLGGCPRDVVLDRRASGGAPGGDAPRLFDEQRDHVPHQRRTCVRGGRARAVGRGLRAKWKALRSLTRSDFASLLRTIRLGGKQKTRHAAAAVPAASLLEHGAIPSRWLATPSSTRPFPNRQSGAPPSAGSQPAAGRARAARQRRRADERVRIRAAVPRAVTHDTSRADAGTGLLGGERRRRVERTRVPVSRRGAPAAAAEVRAAACRVRNLLDRRDGALDTGLAADRQHQPRALARRIGKPGRPPRATGRGKCVDTGRASSKISRGRRWASPPWCSPQRSAGRSGPLREIFPSGCNIRRRRSAQMDSPLKSVSSTTT